MDHNFEGKCACSSMLSENCLLDSSYKDLYLSIALVEMGNPEESKFAPIFGISLDLIFSSTMKYETDVSLGNRVIHCSVPINASTTFGDIASELEVRDAISIDS